MLDRDRLERWSYAALRIVAGTSFALHGVQKILGLLTTRPQPAFGSQMWIGGAIELVCGALIALGWFTRPAAFLASGTMAVAYLQFHWKGQLGVQLLPISNGGEMAVIYTFLFLWMAVRGGGAASLDGVWRRG